MWCFGIYWCCYHTTVSTITTAITTIGNTLTTDTITAADNHCFMLWQCTYIYTYDMLANVDLFY